MEPEDIEFKEPDLTIKQIKCKIDDTIYVAIVKIWPEKLIQQLKKLHKHYELIVFTILPEGIVDELYNIIPELKTFVSHTLSYDNLVFNADQ
jgi:hypothetical protein